MTDRVRIRAARPDELAAVERIEIEADRMLIAHLGAAEWPPPAGADERADLPGFLLVAAVPDDTDDDEPIGFAHVLEIDDQAHLEQLSVLPCHGGRGLGRMLVEAAKHETQLRGYERLTLRTYRDVPWNAPFYASCGFRATVPSTPFLERLVDVEAALGLDRYGVRLQMTADL